MKDNTPKPKQRLEERLIDTIKCFNQLDSLGYEDRAVTIAVDEYLQNIQADLMAIIGDDEPVNHNIQAITDRREVISRNADNIAKNKLRQQLRQAIIEYTGGSDE